MEEATDMRTWRPIPIEEFYRNHPDILAMWKVLEPTEEKSVPISGDEPIARSKKVDMTGIFRTNFNPKENWNHLLLVAEVLGIEELPIIHEYAFQVVLDQIKSSIDKP